jgi:hypothetical protein
MTGIPYKEILSAVATLMTFVAFYPYLRGILGGTVTPHVFSWVIWAATTLVVFFAQVQSGGGVGAWPIGISGGITAVIALLAYARRADASITRSDWLFFISALASLPLWYFTSDPMWAVVVLTAVDILGFGPTLRKAYAFPHSESPLFFALFAVRNFLVVLALESYSIATVLFPAAVAVACVLVIALIVVRRGAVGSPGQIP